GNFYIIVEADPHSKKGKEALTNITPYFAPGVLPSSDNVPEFKDEGNNAIFKPLSVVLRLPPDLAVTTVAAPEHATVGQFLSFSLPVTNNGGATRTQQDSWTDSVFLSRDPYLDTNADRYLGSYGHTGGLASGASYSISDQLRLPRDLVGPYYLFVVTDPY